LTSSFGANSRSLICLTSLCLGAGLILTWTERRSPRTPALLLLIPILFFALVTVVRLEPFTRLVGFGLTLSLMFILTLSWLGGGWWRYNLRDYIYNSFSWIGVVIARPARAYARRRSNGTSPNVAPAAGTRRSTGRILLSILLGIVIALPLLIFFGALLASADPVFGRELNTLLEVLRLENLMEYGFRLAYILALGYILSRAC